MTRFRPLESLSLQEWRPEWKLTIFGRSLVLLISELLVNVACWVAAGLIFGRHTESRGLLSLAVLAWTIGLRHGLDADHISAIDNATRGLISLGQLSVTCGLFFSLGHSTIVIAVICAIAISTDVYDKLGNVSDVGGTIGSIISASFLFLLGLANSIILFRIVRARRKHQRALRQLGSDNGISTLPEYDQMNERSLMMRILGRVTRFVDRPWKMYPVGVLFGLGFDTASSIALLAVSALAKNSTDGVNVSQSSIVILPFLFTAGMTIVDSADSILMLYSYAGFPERGWRLFERSSIKPLTTPELAQGSAIPDVTTGQAQTVQSTLDEPVKPTKPQTIEEEIAEDQSISKSTRLSCSNAIQGITIPSLNYKADTPTDSRDLERDRNITVKQNMMSNLSVILTLVSILLAFSISLIEIMGVIGANCKSCEEAANADDGGGLAGSWWRGWASANNNSGYIGAGIVGGFVIIVASWYTAQWMRRRAELRAQRRQMR